MGQDLAAITVEEAGLMKQQQDGRDFEPVPLSAELSLSDDSSSDTPFQFEDEILAETDDAPQTAPQEKSVVDPCHLIGQVIGPANLFELASCPCCQQKVDTLQPQTLNEPKNYRKPVLTEAARNRSLLSPDSGEEEDEEDDNDDDHSIEEEEDVLPGILAAGVHYTPRHILVEGWLNKKGTGKDWLGSRAWKVRWARLALAKVDGYDIDVPILIIYWYPTSSTPSTVLVLDSTVVIPLDLENNDRWNCHRFEIRHVPKQGGEPLATRTFSAPKGGRDAWVGAMCETLLAYEKHKDKCRKIAHMQRAESMARRSRSPERANNSPITYDEVWTGDRFVTVELRTPISPVPSSPPSPKSPGRNSHPPRPKARPTSPNLPRPKLRRPTTSSPPPSSPAALTINAGPLTSRPRPFSLRSPRLFPQPASENQEVLQSSSCVASQ